MNRILNRPHFNDTRQVNPRNRGHDCRSTGAEENLVKAPLAPIGKAEFFFLRNQACNRAVRMKIEVQFFFNLVQIAKRKKRFIRDRSLYIVGRQHRIIRTYIGI